MGYPKEPKNEVDIPEMVQTYMQEREQDEWRKKENECRKQKKREQKHKDDDKFIKDAATEGIAVLGDHESSDEPPAYFFYTFALYPEHYGDQVKGEPA